MVVIDGEMKSLTSEFIEQVTVVLSNVLMLMFMEKSEKVCSEKLTSEFIEQVTLVLMLIVFMVIVSCNTSQMAEGGQIPKTFPYCIAMDSFTCGD